MKLYVFGQTSANPEDWNQSKGMVLVLAESPEHANELAGDFPSQGPVEVDMSKAAIVCYLERG